MSEIVRRTTAWLHRLWCVAYAARGANSTITTSEGSAPVGRCSRCGSAMMWGAAGHLSSGDIFTISGVRVPVAWWKRGMIWLGLRKAEPRKLRTFVVTGALDESPQPRL